MSAACLPCSVAASPAKACLTARRGAVGDAVAIGKFCCVSAFTFCCAAAKAFVCFCRNAWSMALYKSLVAFDAPFALSANEASPVLPVIAATSSTVLPCSSNVFTCDIKTGSLFNASARFLFINAEGLILPAIILPTLPATGIAAPIAPPSAASSPIKPAAVAPTVAPAPSLSAAVLGMVDNRPAIPPVCKAVATAGAAALNGIDNTPPTGAVDNTSPPNLPAPYANDSGSAPIFASPTSIL